METALYCNLTPGNCARSAHVRVLQTERLGAKSALRT
jgi:hypothetical protein